MTHSRSSNEAAPSGSSVGQLEKRKDDPPHLPRDRGAELVLVHDSGLHERFPEAAMALALHERLRLAEVGVGDATQCYERFTQAVLAEVAGGEHDPAVIEERGLGELARADVQVAAAALVGQAADHLGDRG
jgi:hypothetical protein